MNRNINERNEYWNKRLVNVGFVVTVSYEPLDVAWSGGGRA